MKNDNEEKTIIMPVFQPPKTLRQRWVWLFLLSTSLVFCQFLFYRLPNWGRSDWDQHFFYHGVPYTTLVEYHQFPLWNPYACGGNVLLANPQTRFLSPLFLLELCFGVVVGLKIEIWLHLLIGLYGMYLIASRLYRLTPVAALIPPAIYMFSGMYTTHLAAGHTNFLSLAYFPYVYYFFMKSLAIRQYAVFTGLVFAVMIFEGGTYTTFHAVLFMLVISLFSAIRSRSARPFFMSGLAGVTGGLVSACKLLPMIELLRQFPRQMPSTEALTFKIFTTALFSRSQTLSLKLPQQLWSWWEYGCYIGIFALLLGVIGILLHGKKEWPLLCAGIVFLALTWGNFSPWAPWTLLHQMPFLQAFQVPSRFIHVVVFVLAIFAGFAINRLETFRLQRSVFPWLMLALAMVSLCTLVFDLSFVNSRLFLEAFPYLPPPLTPQPEFRQTLGHHHDMYRGLLENRGTLDCYEPIHFPQRAIPDSDPAYRGEVFTLGGGEAHLSSWSPNRVTVTVKGKGIVCLNQNYAPGWKTKEGRPVGAVSGLIAAEFTPDDSQITFYYLPGTVVAGCVISVLSIWIAAVSMFISHKKVRVVTHGSQNT